MTIGSSVIEYVLSVYEALGSILTTKKQKQQKKPHYFACGL